jgi:hypothetical protein
MKSCFDFGSSIVRKFGEDEKELLLGQSLKESLLLYEVEL